MESLHEYFDILYSLNLGNKIPWVGLYLLVFYSLS
jgi:hypothetical protein